MRTRKERAKQELEALAMYIKGDVVHEDGVQVLNIASAVGEGKVKCVCFDEGLIALEFDIRLKEDHTVYLNHKKRDRAYFLYCLEGNCLHKFRGDEDVNKLEELQTAVISNTSNLLSELLIRKEERLILNLIRIDKNKYIKKFKEDNGGIHSNMLAFLDSNEANEGYFHLGKINLEIAELIKMLEKAKYVDDLSTLMQFEGICQLILAKQIAQFKFELEFDKTQFTTLLKRELKEIFEIVDFIENYPEIQHSIRTLCEKSGLSAAKLQQGFRFMRDMTVGEFIRDTRLKKAELYLRTTDMNISEVVYAIGFTSRSYFCKIFKLKYRCSPKRYKQNLLRSEMKSA